MLRCILPRIGSPDRISIIEKDVVNSTSFSFDILEG
jgi:hypothetical protein